MDKDAREKLFEMHGTVKRLDEKTDNMLKKQGELESDINKLEKDVKQVDNQATNNQKKIYGLFLLGSTAATCAVIIASIFSGMFN